MATKIRLARHGKKGKPFYHIVAADARAPRDGRYIERIGSYNPNTNPAIIDINFERALDWVMKGAQPTDTVKAMLSYRGVMYKKHLLNGVKKGALTNDQVEERFNAWLEEKENKIQGKKDQLTADAKTAADKALALEKEKNEARAKELADAAAALVAEETATEEAATEAKAEEPAAEVKAEEPAAEVKAEEPAAEAKAEEPAAEVKAEEPAAEAKAEEGDSKEEKA
ncbi:MAG: 30S ribosomal protein S16 [Parvicellaceae bacterium]